MKKLPNRALAGRELSVSWMRSPSILGYVCIAGFVLTCARLMRWLGSRILIMQRVARMGWFKALANSSHGKRIREYALRSAVVDELHREIKFGFFD